MKFSLLAMIAALNIDGAEAGRSRGSCKSFPTQQNFSGEKYQGRWYDVASDFWLGVPCTTADYLMKDNGDLSVFNRGYAWWYFFSYFTAEGAARCSSDGKCRVDLGSRSLSDGPINYNVIQTNYDNYTFVYSCRDKWWGKEEDAWILTRDWDLS